MTPTDHFNTALTYALGMLQCKVNNLLISLIISTESTEHSFCYMEKDETMILHNHPWTVLQLNKTVETIYRRMTN